MSRFSGFLGIVISVVVLVVLASAMFGFFFGRPVFVSYVLSSSMEPTLSAGDVIFINPVVLSPGVGDVIVFRSGEGYLVHRIVGITKEGFITKGDNNIASDQLNGKPYVKHDDIAGGVFSLIGKPIAIPHAGSYVKDVASVFGKNKIFVAALLLIAGLLLAVDRDGGKRKRKKTRTDLKISFPFIYFLFSIIIILIASLSMVMVTEARYIDYSITVAVGSSNPDWFSPGAVFQRSMDIENQGRYPYIYRLEILGTHASTDEKTLFMLRPGEKKSVLFTINAPMKSALYAEEIRVWKYLPLLPVQAVDALAAKSPYLPVLAIDTIVAGMLLAVFFLIGGRDEAPVRIRTRVLRRIRFEVLSRLNV